MEKKKPARKVLSGSALSPIEGDMPFVEGVPVVLAAPAPAVPAMTKVASTEYALLATQAIAKAMREIYEMDGVLILPGHGGEWLDVIRVAIHTALLDGYKCLQSGVPVAIRADAPIAELCLTPEQQPEQVVALFE
ncbi:hypothetical protein [Sinimarinibacterium sp. NLF-5-8]|uniref:hypothetical protein n=1 Tax=Sinimarinibacterium sp. NLF-5-8 TaxID=2698684 RepID=UPI00137C07A6|nr:hypothetical protein [Sinimarinibacterium sp. NLF-5-8]QHS09113.1 hypothetical protein GT972_02395 [Sinimarinibacterium sp. NLF-5-8]